MSYAWMAVAVVIAVLIWPINRSVMQRGGSSRLFGFWIAASGAIVSAPIAFGTGQVHFTAEVWCIGAAIGIAYALGYCLIVMHCLRIGPTGPTVALNNMGLVWAAAAGILWLKPRPITPIMAFGFVAVLVSLALFGTGARGNNGSHRASRRWLGLALAGWVFAGISMTSQAVAGAWYPSLPFGMVFIDTLTAAILLAPVARSEGRPWFSSPETIGGIASGVINTLGVAATLSALQGLTPQLVFPFTIAGPMVVVQALGHFAYKERLGPAGWLACALGIAGLVALIEA